MPIDQFWQLPRHPSYKYEYVDGDALITPRMRGHTAVLDLHRFELLQQGRCPFEFNIVPINASHWLPITRVFIDSFESHPPFCGVADAMRRTVAHDCLDHTRQGLDGTVVHEASGVAVDADAEPLGFSIVTMVGIQVRHPGKNKAVKSEFEISPHLTWIAVKPMISRHGIGSRLLMHAVDGLRSLGHDRLYSTFIDANLAAVFWHWKRGFQLKPIRVNIDASQEDPVIDAEMLDDPK